MKTFLSVILVTFAMGLGAFNTFAADEKKTKMTEEEQEIVYTKVSAVCQKQISEDDVADAKLRKEQIAECIEKGIADAIEGGE